MQTTYGTRKRSPGKTRKKRKQQGNGQLIRLLLCVAVFLMVYIGKGVWPSKVAQSGEQLLAIMESNTDLRAAFAGLGLALSEQESVLGEIGEFCIAVFAPEYEVQEPDQPAVPVTGTVQDALATDRNQEPLSAEQPETPVGSDPRPPESKQELRVGDVMGPTPEAGQELPEGYDSRWLYLGEREMVTPVRGAVTSQFGYRDHPTIGRYAAHGGVDIAADKGTAVAAFAGGTVKCVGESEDFGLYLELEHGDGVTTFYSHCSKLCVKKGEQVQGGQTVAKVGSTGKSTGPHLHFEIRLDGVRLDPMYYIDPGQEV